MSWALTLDDLCQRYSCLPSQVLAEDASVLMPMLRIAQAVEKGRADRRVSDTGESGPPVGRETIGQRNERLAREAAVG